MKPTHLLLLALPALLLVGCLGEERAPDAVVDVAVKRYDYTPGTAFSLNASLGETVLLRLHGQDVTHGFSILEYGVNVEIPPGQVVEVRLQADKAGLFTIFCTVFCGTGHPQHKGTLHVA